MSSSREGVLIRGGRHALGVAGREAFRVGVLAQPGQLLGVDVAEPEGGAAAGGDGEVRGAADRRAPLDDRLGPGVPLVGDGAPVRGGLLRGTGPQQDALTRRTHRPVRGSA